MGHDFLEELGICSCCGEVKTPSTIDIKKARLRLKLQKLKEQKELQVQNPTEERRIRKKKKKKKKNQDDDKIVKQFQKILEEHTKNAPLTKISLSPQTREELIKKITFQPEQSCP
jgi:hypothetical protein